MPRQLEVPNSSLGWVRVGVALFYLFIVLIPIYPFYLLWGVLPALLWAVASIVALLGFAAGVSVLVLTSLIVRLRAISDGELSEVSEAGEATDETES